jgi:hypothetical protein
MAASVSPCSMLSADGRCGNGGSDAAVAGLADAFLALNAPTGMRRRHQAHAARELTSIGELTPAEDLLGQDPAMDSRC